MKKFLFFYIINVIKIANSQGDVSMKTRKYRTSDTDVRTALWEVYGYEDFYRGEKIKYREMEIDHIIPVHSFDNKEELARLLKDVGAPIDFECDSLFNYVPTRRGTNIQKSNKINKARIIDALEAAKKNYDEVLRKIEKYNKDVEITETAAQLSQKLKYMEDEDMEQAIDIILDDIFDYEDEYKTNEIFCSEKTISMSYSKISFKGTLPDFQNMNAKCSFEFRSLKIRNCLFTVYGNNNIYKLFSGVHTDIKYGYRAFIKKNMMNNEYFITLNNTIFVLPEADTKQLCEIIDKYYDEFINSLNEIDNKHNLSNYEVCRDGIVLFKTSYYFYMLLSNIVDKIKSINDFNIFIDRFQIRIEQGMKLCAIISLVQINSSCGVGEPEIQFVLKPYYIHEASRNEKFWTVQETTNWIDNVLIKELAKHLKNKSSPDICSALKKCENVQFDYNRICSNDDLMKVVCKLQDYYSLNTCKLPCSDIYNGLINLLTKYKLEQDSLDYICSHLDNCKDIEDIIPTLQKNSISKERYIDSKEIEIVLRLWIETLRHITQKIQYIDIKNAVESLKKIIVYYNKNQLLKKYNIDF